jgi:hypothetical protein
MKNFIERVRSADKLLQSSFLEGKKGPNVRQSWNRGIVRKGSGDYTGDIKLEYDINL